MTVFLEDPNGYDGGELTVESPFGEQAVKLPAGHAILYPSSSLHRVEPVTRGMRVASFFWIQSMIRDDGARRILFEMDQAVQRLAADLGQGDRSVIELTGVYHNLLRRWADA
jgi:PKHD-type hydroxylase